MKLKNILGILFPVILTILVVLSGTSRGYETADALIPIRIGWQVPSATQAQIVEVLKRTDVLDTQGLEPTLVPFSFGAPEIESALAGKLDVVLSGDQPAVNLISRGGKWKIVARLNYDRVAIMVPIESTVQEFKDLKGKTIASPFGSVAHREVILQEKAAGLNPYEEVKNKDMDILEIRRLVQEGGIDKWGSLDAVAVWEPLVSEFDFEQHARTLYTSPTLNVVAFSKSFIAKHPNAPVRFLVALVRAWYYFSQNAEKVRSWYIDDAQLGYTPEALLAAAKLDPNFDAKSLLDIDLNLTDQHFASLEVSATWRKGQGFGNRRFKISRVVDQTFLAKAMETIAADKFKEPLVILPSAREAPIYDAPNNYFFDKFPLWLIFMLMIAISLLAFEAGQLMGKWHLRTANPVREGPVGTVVAAVLGLLAFVIALTFSAASDKYDARKQTLLEEVNAVATAYLRAGLLPEPHKTTTQSLLRDYVEVRIGMSRVFDQTDKLLTVQRRAAALQNSLWSHVKALADKDRRSPIYAMFASSINDVFDLHTKRIVLGVEYRIPFFVWCALGLASCLAMIAVGFHFGISARRRSFAACWILSLTFALVVILIFDMDRPGEGMIHVNQRPMIELYHNLSLQQ